MIAIFREQKDIDEQTSHNQILNFFFNEITMSLSPFQRKKERKSKSEY